jgi:hypothetical protein
MVERKEWEGREGGREGAGREEGREGGGGREGEKGKLYLTFLT